MEVLVLAGYRAQKDDELSLAPGDLVRQVCKGPAQGWLRGELRGHCGLFPECLVQHDDREGEGSEKWVSRGRGRGAFPRGRGRFMFRKSSTSPKWAHDKFSGEEGEIEDDESGTENREEKDNLQPTAE
ncbi:hypothetical protein CB1_000884029 [Camelus ferus]|nr:hypothetical protein CB1_000884029 [Camelus ferus]